MSKFVHLHTHSHYSLLDGMSKIPDLVDKAKKDGMTALAITDHGNLYGAIEFYKACKAKGIKPILGIEAYVSPGDHTEKTSAGGGQGGRDYFHLILLVKNQTGWENLLKLSSESWLNGFYYKPRMDKKMLREHHEGLIALSGCLGGEISQALLANNNEQAEKIALEYQEIFGKDNYYIEIQKHDNTKDIVAILPKQVALATRLGIPMVATCDSHYLNASDREPHDILLAIQTGKKVADKDRLRLEDDFSFLSQDEALKKFADYPEAVENTIKIADACNFEIELGKILLPKFATPDGSDSKTFLRNLVKEKINARYPNPSAEAKERVEYELGIIEKTGFADYFLIVQDFINWAKDRGVVVGPGRGSAAGSIISYILNITDLDPIAYELLFERFLNPERIQMPDIDIDIADTRRGEVFGYIQEKYGADHVAHIITFGTMAARAAIRDVGRALDIELSFCDRMSKLIPFNKDLDGALKEVDELAMLYKTDERAKQIIDSARRLEGVARHASVHACGTLISADQLVKRVPLQHAPADDTITLTQFEMHSIDDLGLLKIDLLGLKNLTIIEDTIRLIKDMHPSTGSGQTGTRIDIGTIPLNDKEAFELFQRADTVGVFQLECLTGDTRVSNTTIERLYHDQKKKALRSVYLDSGLLHNNKIQNVVRSGNKKVFRMVAENGRMIKTSADHMFMTQDGWKKLSDLKVGKDQVLFKPKSGPYAVLQQCIGCGTAREILSENLRKHHGFCYACSAKHFSNPSKPQSRLAISESQKAFYAAGGEPWNSNLTKETSSILLENGKKIAKALVGRTNEMKFGVERAEIMHRRASKRFSGENNPMFGKKPPHRKGGIRADLGHYVRSNWEADFARILNLHNVAYEYEPHTFTVIRENGEKLSYTPDFFTLSTNTYYEIKGWLHDLDAEKMRLFEQQYPQYNFVLIDKTKFAEFAMQYKSLVAWECPRVPNQLEFAGIKSIEPLGEQMTYDILMETPGNNFIANSFVVHNSGGMRRYLKELKPTELEDIIAMVSLYRPGPMELIPSYIQRKYGKEKVTYLHEKLEPILKKTYGIGIYQEQMMRIASDLAGYTLAEADTLRKAIGKKIKKLLEEQEQKLVNGMIKNNIPERTARAIWGLFPPFARYGFNRCLTGETRMQNPETGQLITITELFKNRKLAKSTTSLNEQTLKTYKNKIVNVLDNGIKEVFELKTRSGRRITATANHPFYTTVGWQNLESLKLGDRLATPRSIAEPIKPNSVASHKLTLLGYLLSEGNMCHPHGFYYYAKDPIEVADYCKALSLFSNTQPTIDKSKATTAVYSRRTDLKKPSEAVEWIDSLGMKYKKATEKVFPAFVFQLSNKNLSLLIAKMFQGDGCINDKRDPQIFYATSSWMIARDMQHLLLRLNVLSTIHTKKFKYRGDHKIGYTISINRYDNIRKFLNAVIPHLVGRKQATVRKILISHPIINGLLNNWAARGSKDTIPVSLVMAPLREAAYATVGGFSQAEQRYGIPERFFHYDMRKKGYLREMIEKISDDLNSKKLETLATSDIYWDEIVSIAPVGKQQTYDLTMEKDHNFVANDIFVHNSHAACYAMIAYRTAYLKAHYPTEFMTALFNSESGDIERITSLIAEAKKMEVKVLAPDINKSSSTFTPEGKNVRFGLSAIKNVGENIVAAIIETRNQIGEFTSFENFIGSVKHKDLNKKSLESMIKCGALDSFGIERNQLLANIEDITKYAQASRKETESNNQSGLFGVSFKSTAKPKSLVLKPAEPATPAEKLLWEKELLGLYVSEHPLTYAKEKMSAMKPTLIKSVLAERSNIHAYRIAGMVASVKSIVTKTGKPMCFAKIEDTSGSIEVVIFSDTYATCNQILKEGKIVALTGRLSFRNGEPSIVCENIKELT